MSMSNVLEMLDPEAPARISSCRSGNSKTPRLTDEVMFSIPAMVAARRGGKVTPVTIMRDMQKSDFRERVQEAESATMDAYAMWAPAVQRHIAVLCPGWIVSYDIFAECWRARRANGSGYYDGSSTRSYGVQASGLLHLFVMIEHQSLLDIEYLYPDWHVCPSDESWCAIEDRETSRLPRLVYADTATALTGILAAEPDITTPALACTLE